MKKLTSKGQGTATINRNHDAGHSYWNLAILSSETKDLPSGPGIQAPYNTSELL